MNDNPPRNPTSRASGLGLIVLLAAAAIAAAGLWLNGDSGTNVLSGPAPTTIPPVQVLH